MTSRLEAVALAIGHGTVIADGLDLAVAPAEIVAIVGPSGCGKSTLLASVAGVVPAMGGQVLVDGTDVTSWPVHRRRIGMIFQEPLLFPHLDVGDNVAYGLRRLGVPKRAARRQAVDALTWVDLAGYADRPIERLSGGQAQRVALARALAPRPAVLLLDEPFSALDSDLRQRLAADVADLLHREQMAAVHVTHDLDEARAMAARVLRMPTGPGQPLASVPR